MSYCIRYEIREKRDPHEQILSPVKSGMHEMRIEENVVHPLQIKIRGGTERKFDSLSNEYRQIFLESSDFIIICIGMIILFFILIYYNSFTPTLSVGHSNTWNKIIETCVYNKIILQPSV